GGGTELKPVGLVYIGLNAGGCHASQEHESSESMTEEFHFHGDRQTVKLRASQAALNILRHWLMKPGNLSL
ncbi:MAG: hypothetical protein C4294_06860, partial [Nitrospiraceae bacterium]